MRITTLHKNVNEGNLSYIPAHWLTDQIIRTMNIGAEGDNNDKA
jgi:hypothetical protein